MNDFLSMRFHQCIYSSIFIVKYLRLTRKWVYQGIIMFKCYLFVKGSLKVNVFFVQKGFLKGMFKGLLMKKDP